MPAKGILGAVTLADEGLIDLHCHILPGLDNGPRDMSDARAMAAQAAADGIAVVCATPHVGRAAAGLLAALPVARQRLAQALDADGCELVVLSGGEVASEALSELSDEDLAAVSLGGGGRWILLAPPPGALDRRIDRAVARLTARGLHAVIAHPERHTSTDLGARLARLTDRGCLIQATAAAVVSRHAGVLDLARGGLIHVLGSDAHSAQAGRPPPFSAAFGVLAQVDALAPHIEWMRRSAPRAILAGDVLSPPY